MKKKILLGITFFSLLLVLSVGVTQALFSDKEQVQNTIQTGKVDIETKETIVENGKTDVGVTNKGPNDCWVRLLVTIPEGAITVENGDNAVVYIPVLYTGNNPSNGSWNLSSEDNYYYYSKPLKAGETAYLYESITISETLKEDQLPSNLDIIVYSEAIQKGITGQEGETASSAFQTLKSQTTP